MARSMIRQSGAPDLPKQRKLSLPRLLISCEHASSRLPASYGTLGLPARHRNGHIAWDAGAAAVARHVAAALGCPLREGRYSRLLIDLNRSLHNRALIPVRSGGVLIPGNAGISRLERSHRVRRYYEPYRRAVLDAVAGIARKAGACLHVSVHSFAPRLDGAVRRADIGILYDPARSSERRLAIALAGQLAAHGLRVRRNYPYRGKADGLATHCRRVFPARSYVGVEIEINQRLLRTTAGCRRMAGALVSGLRDARAFARGGRPEQGAALACKCPSIALVVKSGGVHDELQ